MGGEADQRGVKQGDRLVEIGGVWTSGKGREQLLPLLKTRPLLLKIDREDQVLGTQEPHCELNLQLPVGFEDHGLDVAWRGQMPVATVVRTESAAWAAGIVEGDGIFQVGGQDATRMSKSALLSALEDWPARAPLPFKVWR